MRVSLVRIYFPTGQAESIANMGRFGREYPAREDRKLRLEWRIGWDKGQIEPEFLARTACELLDQQWPVLDIARDRLLGDMARRIVRLVQAQAGEVFLAALALMMTGVRGDG